MLPSQPLGQQLPSGGGSGIVGDIGCAFRHALIFLISLAAGDLVNLFAVFLQQLHQVAVRTGGQVVSQNGNAVRIHRPGAQRQIQTAAHQLIRGQAAFSHNGVHVAVSKVDIRKTLLQHPVHHFQITTGKMVDTAGIDQHHRGPLGQPLQNVRHALNEQILQVSVQQVVFPDLHGGEPIQCVHFRRRQHHAPQTAGGADEDLMGFGDQHPRVDDVPGSPGRCGVFQTGSKGIGVGGFANGDARLGLWRADRFQHGSTPQISNRVLARARYSWAMGLSGKASMTVLP